MYYAQQYPSTPDLTKSEEAQDVKKLGFLENGITLSLI